jgi:serine/threonine protein kinase
MDPGRRLGHYDIQAKLGAGGMGTVYLALDTRLNRLVALKILAPDRWEGTAGRGRLIREAQAASSLNHPNIVTVYEVGHEADVDFIAMERVDGKTLRDVIERRPPVRETLPIAIQVAGAIAAAHAAGIVHRDLKPTNIMVTERGLVKILDFGIAKVAAATSESNLTQTLTQPGQILGTVAYMSPEQAAGKEVDWRSDIFSFGCVLYEMITGRRAFHEDTEMATLAAVIAKDPASARQFAPELTPVLERIVDHCLRKKREDRWQSMEDVKLLLASATDRREIPPLRMPTRSRSERRERHRPASVGMTDSGGRRKLLQGPRDKLVWFGGLEQALVAEDAANFFGRDGKPVRHAGDFAVFAAPHLGDYEGGEFFDDLLK